MKWINSTLDAADELDRKQPDPGRPVVRRLTPGEYNRTLRDLLGVDFDASGAVGMPDDSGESFDNLAAASERRKAASAKRLTQAVHHKPRALVRHAERAMHLMRGHAFL